VFPKHTAVLLCGHSPRPLRLLVLTSSWTSAPQLSLSQLPRQVLHFPNILFDFSLTIFLSTSLPQSDVTLKSIFRIWLSWLAHVCKNLGLRMCVKVLIGTVTPRPHALPSTHSVFLRKQNKNQKVMFCQSHQQRLRHF